MPFPNSPFKYNFNCDVLYKTNDEPPHTSIQFSKLENTLKWLCKFPKITSYRINTLKCNIDDIKTILQGLLTQTLGNVIVLKIHPLLSDVLILNHSYENKNINSHDKEVIIDPDCAAAVLRGAHIYAPGVMGLVSGVQLNDKISIYADLSKKCKKGFQKTYTDENKLFIGNGLVKMRRFELFGEDIKPSGIAIEVTETISGCPPIGDKILDDGLVLLQNLPSIICVKNLNPQPGETILDMCASPGNKTTHIAALMKNKGILVALDKTLVKVKRLLKNCEEFDAKVYVYQADSTKILDDNASNEIHEGPPFKSESFDRILLDAPCSALGKRPQLYNNTTEKVIKSYVPLQRKLFETAVNLLKPNGTLVFSTCTITLAENEGLIAWALKNFSCLRLVHQKFHLGSHGWQGSALNEDQRRLVQRFDCTDNVDSVGFFIAGFIKEIT
ncbi:unnamed protein product [Brassicogethes aeneus]|uniref:SAM-dependent MTase RsmB/NOP-type domain-containing protein n=1 Tax=Brassicogethes aeneus TaxID=1431903 RepID=A0A9P0B4T9_BRAAE|nr:unnamed protein product [Brassicogethes aeneus]